MKPRIALLTRLNDGRYTANQDYVNALLNAGADITLLLPQSKESLYIELYRCDGLLIPGGDDVDPKQYNQENLHSHPINISIEQLDLDSIDIMQQMNKPIFGICRGLQILNVAFGGTLIQDINLQKKDSLDHNFSFNYKKSLNAHKIIVSADSILSNYLDETIEVNSYHHQAIDKLAPNFKISAKSEDGLIEAIESERMIAVQWHPERMCSIQSFQNLFNGFVSSCIK